MQTNYEKALELVSSLPPSDLEKLGEWIRTKRHQEENGNAISEQTKEEVRKYKLAKKWIAVHKKEFIGQWVCLEGDELISHGTDAVEVHNQAKAEGIEAPFLERIIDEPEYYSDGWEACQ